MKARTAVLDWSGNYEENCIQLGKHLEKNTIRRKLFDAIYGRGSKPRSKKQMMAALDSVPDMISKRKTSSITSRVTVSSCVKITMAP